MGQKKTDGSQKPPRKHVATPRPRGRPCKLTPEVQAAICKLIVDGVPRTKVGPLIGLSNPTIHGWLQQGKSQETGVYRDFFNAVATAESELLQRAVRAVTGMLDPAAKVEDSTRLNAAKFILSHRFREDFTTRTETELTGKDGGPVQVDATVRPLFSDAQLASLSPEQIAATVRGLVSGSGGE